jgi:hypothetical protein
MPCVHVREALLRPRSHRLRSNCDPLCGSYMVLVLTLLCPALALALVARLVVTDTRATTDRTKRIGYLPLTGRWLRFFVAGTAWLIFLILVTTPWAHILGARSREAAARRNALRARARNTPAKSASPKVGAPGARVPGLPSARQAFPPKLGG